MGRLIFPGDGPGRAAYTTTDAVDGPYRKVTGMTEPVPGPYNTATAYEVLECGHPGRRLLLHYGEKPGKRRRCFGCEWTKG
jgi:hypothetical protein